MQDNIKTVNELEFAIFCIENLARRFNVSGVEMYRLLAEKSNILADYIVPGYETLHTQDKEYILDELVEVMQERGISV